MKIHYKFLIILLIVVVGIGAIVVLNKTSQNIVCNKPYILVGTSCCLDQNDNSICDRDETISRSTPLQEGNQQETSLNKSTALVSKVIDGDSIELQNGIEVRLLGINAPERGQPYYQEATNRLKELVEGKSIVLENDVQDKDQYGRLLRYIFVDDLFVNLELVKEGYATVYILSPNVKYEKELKAAWSDCLSKHINLCKQPTGENICDSRCIGISYFKWNAEGDDCDNLNGEYVTFVNTCPYSCDLTNWTVKDESSRNLYIFPTFVLESGKTVTLYTGCGTNTKTQLYWCSSGYSCNAIWNNNGDTLYLRNSKGELVLNYSYIGFS
jgi:micrococcal nuclease